MLCVNVGISTLGALKKGEDCTSIGPLSFGRFFFFLRFVRLTTTIILLFSPDVCLLVFSTTAPNDIALPCMDPLRFLRLSQSQSRSPSLSHHRRHVTPPPFPRFSQQQRRLVYSSCHSIESIVAPDRFDTAKQTKASASVRVGGSDSPSASPTQTCLLFKPVSLLFTFSVFFLFPLV